MKRWQIVIAVIAAILASGLLFAWLEYHRKPADTTGLKAIALKDAEALIKEFESDEIAANQRYGGKVLSVNGTVLKIENNNGALNLVLGSESSLAGVICELQEEHIADAAKITPGQQVRIKGICTGMLLDVVMVRCVLDKLSPDDPVPAFDISIIRFNY